MSWTSTTTSSSPKEPHLKNPPLPIPSVAIVPPPCDHHHHHAMDSENRGLDLEKELTCSICTEVLYQPLTLLDCLHTFCGGCLKEWFSWQLSAYRAAPSHIPGASPYTCPSCRATVRDTKHNATVTTLLEMFVAANPDKARTEEERGEVGRKYTPGEDVLVKLEARELSLRERRVEDADRRLVDEVRGLSLREVGVESEEERRERRERRRREEERRGEGTRSSRDNSRDSRNAAEDRDRRRRREEQVERRRVREERGLRPAGVPTEDRRRRRSDDEARRRHEETHRTAARQIEHQSSLRSLISSDDVDSHEMEEEILRQIREEGLLDGIDLENIDVNQEDQISERIAEAFRRRQDERARQDSSRRSEGSGQRRRQSSAPAPALRETSPDEGNRTTSSTTRRRRTHSRSPSAISQVEEPSRPPPSMSAMHAHHLEVNSSDEGRRRRRTRSSSSTQSRSATTPVPVSQSEGRPASRSQTDLSNRPHSASISSSRLAEGDGRPAARSQTDLSNRPQSSQISSRPIASHARSSTDPTVQRAAELPTADRGSRDSPSRRSPNSSPRVYAHSVEAPDHGSRESLIRPSPISSPRVHAHSVEAPDHGSRESHNRPSPNSSPRIASTSQPAEAPDHGSRDSQSRQNPNSSPKIPSTAQSVELPGVTPTSVPKTRKSPPADIFVPASKTPSTASHPAELQGSVDRTLLPAPLSPRMPSPTHMSLSERATAMSSASRPTSSSSPTTRARLELFPEPSLKCARCAKPHIEYDLHYHCSKCYNGNYDICLECYRSGVGCLHWFGFGYAAWKKWERLLDSGELSAGAEQPHMLTASRYVPPKIPEGGADGRRTLTTDDPNHRLQSGAFCANCLAWANECYWRCESCNEGDWGFCNLCVNQGKSCTHALLPLTYNPADSSNIPLTPTHDQQIPPSARILTGPGVMGVGNFKPLVFDTTCDIRNCAILPSEDRYHCFSCMSKVPNTHPGDYDICTACYPKQIASRRISAENGHNGWRRCPKGHRMVIVGFEDSRGGQRRVVAHDLVGGRGLIQEASSITQTGPSGGELQLWTWGEAAHVKFDGAHKKLVTTNVMEIAPTNVPDLVLEKAYPPDGGVGMRGLALWSWYPGVGADDELMFPKGAEIRECKDVNGDWFHGTYMGKKGLFPAPYVKILD